MGNRIIRSIAPLRLGIAGGSSDLPSFVERFGGYVLNATINKYVYASLYPRKDERFSIKSEDYGIIINGDSCESLSYDGNLDLIKAVINRIRLMHTGFLPGFDITVASDAPPGAGLGTSSTVIVAILGLFREWLSLDLNSYELAKLAWDIERKDMLQDGGYQDQYSSAFGGFNFMEFHKDGSVIINPLAIRPWIKRELQHNLLLVYSGMTHRSPELIKEQAVNSEANTKYIQHIKEIAVAAKEDLLTEDLRNFGQILSLEWGYKKKLSNKVSNEVVEAMEEAALEHGAEGLKLTGAGGGGMMIVYADWSKKRNIANALKKLGCQPWDFNWEDNGVYTWSVRG
jgi:D-glycero-alpha-D-manno-heptose-7-phosphate kinase